MISIMIHLVKKNKYRDSALLSEIFSPFDPAVMQLIEMTFSTARKTGTHTGPCGQAPGNYPEYAQFLARNGIDFFRG